LYELSARATCEIELTRRVFDRHRACSTSAMQVTVVAPEPRLARFVRSFTVVETGEAEACRTLLPDTGLVIGFRWRGAATDLATDTAPLPDATIAGMRRTARRMLTSARGSIVLATFHEAGAAAFFREPLHEIFGETVGLDSLVAASEIERVREELSCARDHQERARIVGEFLRRRERADAIDPVVAASVRAIRDRRGAVRVGDLASRFELSRDRLEKRFRGAVGATPKQLASIVRVRHAVSLHRPGANLGELSALAGYFDQSHFTRELRAVTGETPLRFFRDVERC
jgi:AraC-like DNA-binding protein